MATQNILTGATTFGAASAGDTFYIREGNSNITGNTDSSTVNTCVTAEISKGFTGTIGTAGSPWKVAFSTRIVHAGSGTLHHESNSLDTETTALLQVIGGGIANCYGGTAAVYTRAEVCSGRISAENLVTITTGRCGLNGEMYLIDTGTGPTVTTLDVMGGYVWSQRPHTTINGLAGKIVLLADSAGGQNAHGTINAYGSNIEIQDSGTITTLNWYAGQIDISKLSALLTITNTNINMTMPWAQAFLDHPLITFTNTPTRLWTDGRPL